MNKKAKKEFIETAIDEISKELIPEIASLFLKTQDHDELKVLEKWGILDDWKGEITYIAAQSLRNAIEPAIAEVLDVNKS